MQRLRHTLRKRLRDGFWFPALQRAVGWLGDYASIGNRFIRWVDDDGTRKGPAGAAELYVAFTLIVGVGWLALITHSVPVLAAGPVRFIGAAFAIYRVVEIGLFSLDWVFVAQGRLQSERRSLACFLVNLFEVAVFSSIAAILGGCLGPLPTLSVLYNSLVAIFGLGLVEVGPGCACLVIAHTELLVAATVISVVLANLIGSVAPDNTEGGRIVEITPVTLEGQRTRLEPLTLAHQEALIAAAGDGELWNSTVTIVPARDTMAAYIEAALAAQAQGRELPFVIIRKSSGEVVGTTRFYEIEGNDRRVAIGYTWLSRSAQRTAINTEAKLLLLTHAFEHWQCNRVEFITDVLNQQSRAAILRLGAKEEGILRNHMVMPGGRIRDSVCFSIIKAEWPEVKSRLTSRLIQKAAIM